MFRPLRLACVVALALFALLLPLGVRASLRADDDPEYGEWKTVSPAAGYEVQLPKNVKGSHSSSGTSSIGGQTATHHIYAAETSDGIGFVVASLEVTDKLKKISNDDLFKGFQAAFAQSSGYRLTNGKKVKVDGKPGMEWTVRDANGADGVLRMFRASPDRIILLGVAGKGIASSADVVASRFFKSYKANPDAKGPTPDRDDPDQPGRDARARLADQLDAAGKHAQAEKIRDAIRASGGGKKTAPTPGAKLGAFKPEKIADPTKMEGLVAYWSFDEGEGETAKDQGPAKADITLEGKKWVDGVRGKAVRFNGQTGVGEIPAGKALNFPAECGFTVSGWFQIEIAKPAGTIFSMRQQGNGAVIDVFFGRFGGLKAQVRCDERQDHPAEIPAREQPKPGGWRHFALLRAEDGVVSFFLDAVPCGSSGGAMTAGAITTNLRGIGCERLWAAPGGRAMDEPYFKGMIDEVCVFNRALKPEEIASLAGRGGASKDSDKDKAKP